MMLPLLVVHDIYFTISYHFLTLFQLQAGRPPGHRDIYYDEAGNVVSMTKIQADRLPSHRS